MTKDYSYGTNEIPEEDEEEFDEYEDEDEDNDFLYDDEDDDFEDDEN